MRNVTYVSKRVCRGREGGRRNLIKDQFYISGKNDGGSFEYTEERRPVV